MFKQFETMIGDRKLIVETGKYAEQAGGSCLVRCGGTAVLVCATVAKALSTRTLEPGCPVLALLRSQVLRALVSSSVKWGEYS